MNRKAPRCNQRLDLSTPPPRPDPGPWTSVVQATDGIIFRYRVYLTQGGWNTYGPDAWGWHAITLSGARRRADRELRRVERLEARKARRAAAIGGGVR